VWTQTFRLPAGDIGLRRTAEVFFRFFAIQVVIYGAGMVVQALLNARRRFLWPSLGPIFNNVVVIATMLLYVFVFPRSQSAAFAVLAIGTTLGVVTMFAVQIPALLAEGVRLRLSLDRSDPAIRTMLRLAIPTVAYVATNLVSVSFRNSSAFAVSPKGPSILAYAWTFYQLPYGIVAVSVATAVFTELAEAAGRNDMQRYREQLASGLRTTVTIVMPLAAMLIALAEPLVSLYRVGRFTATDVAPVASALRWWAAGLVFYAAMMFLLRCFYALKDTRTPALLNGGLTAAQVGSYVVLSTGIGTWAGLGLIGLPVTDGLFAACMTVALAWLLRRKIGSFELRGLASDGIKMLAGSAGGALLAWGVARAIVPLSSGLPLAVLQLLLGGAVGLATALGIGRLLGVVAVDQALRTARRFLGRPGRT
jgi:putative peptidoglycan lipid II flippase